MEKLLLIVEKSEDGYFGRVNYEDNLIVVDGDDIPTLETQAKEQLHTHHHLDTSSVIFELQFDLSALFEYFDILNVTAIARRAGMNASLLRQYRNGQKYPSLKQVQKIEEVIRTIAKELAEVHILVK